MPNLKQLILKDTRIISGTGTLKFPDDVLRLRYARLNIDVIREVAEPFNSYKYSPARSRYATLCFMKNGYVIHEEAVDYKRRQYDFEPGNSPQNLIALQCSYQGVLDSFANLGTALNLVVVQKDNDIKGYQPMRLIWDEIQVVCESSTAIQVRLYTQELEECEDLPLEPPDEPPPPPPPPPPVPPDQSIDISPPYDPEDPDEPFFPNPLDIPDEPPPELPEVGEPACSRWSITYAYAFPSGGGLIEDTRTLWGQTGGIVFEQREENGFYTIGLVSGGQAPPQVGNACNPGGGVFLAVASGSPAPFTTFGVISFSRLDV